MSGEEARDVVVVGSGAGGLSAAIVAASKGLSVLVVEAAEQPGGTTARSSGGMWIPDNPIMRERGLEDPREWALKHMAVLSFPQAYDPEAPYLGLTPHQHRLLEAYYDHASPALEALAGLGALEYMEMDGWYEGDVGMPPWFITAEDRAPSGRLLSPTLLDTGADPSNPSAEAMNTIGSRQGFGVDLVAHLLRGAQRHGVEVRTGHRMTDLLVEDGRVAAVVCDTPAGPVTARARYGVVCATGGFSRNRELCERFLRGRIVGTVTVPTDRGDLIPIAERLGASLGNMDSGWWLELPFEPTIEDPTAGYLVAWIIFGDSSLLVNRHGRRVVDEKLQYHERAKAHFVPDADGLQGNELLFFVYDDHVAHDPSPWPTRFPVPVPGETPGYVMTADTLPELADRVRERLATLEEYTGGFALAEGFAAGLVDEVARFNGFARTGRDTDFDRGDSPIDRYWNGPAREGNDRNPTMFPLSETGPYHCIIMGAGTMDTNGGVVVDERARVLDGGSEPIPGLYATGNCIASPVGDGYPGGGITIGTALIFGYIAATDLVAAGAGEPPVGWRSSEGEGSTTR